MKMARRSVLLVAALGAGAGCTKAVPHASAEAQVPVNEVWLTDAQLAEAKVVVAPIDEQDVDDTILTSGHVTFDDLRVAHVYSPVTGRITNVLAAVGQRVRRGEPLAVLESPDVGIVTADLFKAQAGFVAAEHDYKRVKGLFESHAASERDVEQSEDAWNKARAELGRARQKASLLKSSGGTAVTQWFTLRAGIEGEVIGRNVTLGMEVQGQYGGGTAVELFTLGELDRVWVVADVYELDIARVRVGSPVTVRAVAYPTRTFDGKVEWMSGVLDKETRTAKLRCSFDNADRALKPEMFVTATLRVDQKRALAIPRSALMRLGDVTVVFVELGKASDGRTRFERVPVSLDEGEGDRWISLGGSNVPKRLAKGVRIVVAGGVLLSSSRG